MYHKKSTHYRPSTAVKFTIALFFGVALLMPLASLFSMSIEVDIVKFLGSKVFIRALWQSMLVASVGAVTSICIGGLLAWCVVRTKMRYKSLFAIILILPMLIPSVSHGIGLVVLYGNNGVLTNFFGFETSIYGFLGIVVGSTMFSVPLAYLMISDILRYEDGSPYEAAQVLGLSPVSQFFTLTVPYMYKPLIAVVFCVFTIIITDYGVPLMIGGKYKTLALLMYQEVIGMLDFAKGSVIGLVLLVPALLAFAIDYFTKEKIGNSFVCRPFPIKKRFFVDCGALAFCTTVSLFVLLPILTFVLLSFVKNYPNDISFSLEHIRYAYDGNALTYLFNSVFIASATSIFGAALAMGTAYFTARMDSPLSRSCHLLSILTLAVPGLVLGLGYIIFFKASFLYGTFAILILVNSMHFFASPYLMAYNTFGKMNKNLEAVGDTLGISRLAMFKDVILPQARATFLEMIAYFFVNSMVTISAVAFLASIATKPLSLLISMFEAHRLFEASAFVSLLILLTNILCKVCIEGCKKRMARN